MEITQSYQAALENVRVTSKLVHDIPKPPKVTIRQATDTYGPMSYATK